MSSVYFLASAILGSLSATTSLTLSIRISLALSSKVDSSIDFLTSSGFDLTSSTTAFNCDCLASMKAITKSPSLSCDCPDSTRSIFSLACFAKSSGLTLLSVMFLTALLGAEASDVSPFAHSNLPVSLTPSASPIPALVAKVSGEILPVVRYSSRLPYVPKNTALVSDVLVCCTKDLSIALWMVCTSGIILSAILPPILELIAPRLSNIQPFI